MMEEDTTILKCDVELSVTAPSMTVANKWIADALRRVTDMVESDQLDNGFHDVTDGAGKKIGEIYVDYSTETIF